MTSIDPWFLAQIEELVNIEKRLENVSLPEISKDDLLYLKKKGFSDKRIARLTHASEKKVREKRHALNLFPVYKRVDT